MRSVDICINGAGPVGTTLACRLAASGLSVLLIERTALTGATGAHLDGRAYALSEGSRQVLIEAGIWEHLPNGAEAIKEIAVIDGLAQGQAHRTLLAPFRTSRPPGLKFDAADYPADRPELSAFGWMAEAQDLRVALNAALKAGASDRLEIAMPDEARFSFDSDGATVSLASGATYRAQLVIGAEGRNSPLRKQAGIPLTRLPYNQSGIIAVISHKNPHEGVALERFLPDGPFARLPLTGTIEAPYRSAIVWAAPSPRAHYLHALPQAAFEREVSQKLDQRVGAATPIGRRWIYPLSAQYAHQYVSGRLALVGDAAHGLHPIAGQGLNMGFRDIRVLANLVIDAFHAGQDVGEAKLLQAYQHQTRPDNMAMLAICDVMERSFASRHPAVRLLRRAGLRALDARTPLRASFIRRTMGLT